MRALWLTLFFFLLAVPAAQADWRWGPPKLNIELVKPKCKSKECRKFAKKVNALKFRVAEARYNLRKLEEWNFWTSLYIPSCTWYGESGRGPKYARYRYTMYNFSGSGAYGKFQFKPGTYHSVAKYHDWSPLDQEIAARREYWKHGIWPWENCT